MKRKLKAEPNPLEILDQLSKMLISAHILKDFQMEGVNELKDSWQIVLREKPDRIPEELKGLPEGEVVFDGNCNPVEVLSHSFALKPVYLLIYRRRWKRSNTDKHFSNQYDFQMKGLKIVPELGIFLKEEN